MGRRRPRSRRRDPSRRLAGDEDELAALVVERTAVEPAVERLRLEPGDVDQAQPLVPRRPPEGARVSRVEHDVDTAVADRVANCVRDRLVLSLPVQASRDRVVEREGVPCETPTWAQGGGDTV